MNEHNARVSNPKTTDFRELLCGMVFDDWTLYDAVERRLTRDDGWGGWPEFLGATFFSVVQRRFEDRSDHASVIGFVAEARAELSGTGDDIDPTSAEALVGTVLGRPSQAVPNGVAITRIELVLIRRALRDLGLRRGELDGLLDRAEQVALEWSQSPGSAQV